jgi:unsaturated chondroitin disaccharide hydrolase
MTADWLTEALDVIASKVLEDEAGLGTFFPYVTGPDGRWQTMPASASAGYSATGWSHGNWFSGFWIGLLLAAYLHRGDNRYLAFARERFQLLAPRAADGNTHDIGFLFWSSAVPLHRITGESRFADFALAAANRLRGRLITTRRGAYISSWGPLTDPRGRASSAIDTMANLPLLYWAADFADDASFRLAGEAHAIMTRASFIRPDLSTYHAVEYALPGGERARGFTFQGVGDESAWSRGQAWAIYGYAATAAATGDAGYLGLVEQLASYYFARSGDALVPFWDFDDPAIPNAPLDSSAAAIVAAALLHVAELHPDPDRGRAARARAVAILEVLTRDYLARDPNHRGVLLHGCYSKPHGIGVDSAVLFGDYYFAEALCRLAFPGRFTAPGQPLTAPASP